MATRRVIQALALLLLAGLAHAQPWPAKPVRVIVNVAPGGVADVSMRVIGAHLSESLGQPVLVDNRPGADGYIGFEAAARADADGYTLLYSPGSTTIIRPHLVRRPDLDPLQRFAPIVATGRALMFVLVHPQLPAATLAAFVEHARAHPGKLNYGTPGNGSGNHIATEVFSREVNIRLNHIPYKGAGPALKDLLGGQIDLAFDPGVGLVHVKAGKLRMLAVVGSRRHRDYPEVPTLEEAGVKGVDSGPHFGFYAPAGTPLAIRERLNAQVQRSLHDTAVRERLLSLAFETAEPMTPDAFAAYLRAQSERYAKLLPQLGIGP